ncbi:MAG: hypothetical protein JWM20_886 [Patescibacteria group bacterium]|nr:hypothetical protein [Patescibacteria group bacterium]
MEKEPKKQGRDLIKKATLFVPTILAMHNIEEAKTVPTHLDNMNPSHNEAASTYIEKRSEKDVPYQEALAAHGPDSLHIEKQDTHAQEGQTANSNTAETHNPQPESTATTPDVSKTPEPSPARAVESHPSVEIAPNEVLGYLTKIIKKELPFICKLKDITVEGSDNGNSLKIKVVVGAFGTEATYTGDLIGNKTLAIQNGVLLPQSAENTAGNTVRSKLAKALEELTRQLKEKYTGSHPGSIAGLTTRDGKLAIDFEK